jgi:polar amino acid transport system substrate-binding protein
MMREMAPLEARLQRDARLTMLGRLTGALSHEIRNPLSTLSLYADILDEELHRPTPNHRAQLEEAVQSIKTAIARRNELVQDSLSLARLS